MGIIAAAKAVHSGVLGAERTLEADYYRADIDGLRGIAVIAVVAFHAFPAYFPGGFIGVDVFFVISGYLISGIILRQLQRSSFAYTQFYVRRVLRIFPALTIVLAASLLLGTLVLLPDELAELGKHVASASVFASNFTLWQETGYFNRAAEAKPLLHLWSLGVEEQFYLIWPLLLLMLWKPPRHNLALRVFLLTVTSFALALVVGPIDSPANFYLPFTRFWELGLGCLLAVAMHSNALRSRWSAASHSLSDRMHSALAVTGVGMIAVAMFTLDRHTPFPGAAALLPTIGTACVILARSGTWFAAHVLASGGLLKAGLISYPLYLWHWPLLSFAAILESGEPRISVRVVAIMASVGLAWLTFEYIERPVRARRHGRDALALVIVLVVLGGAGLFVYTREGLPGRYDLDVSAFHAEPRTDPRCLDQFGADANFNYCKSTRSGTPPQVVFLGDSRAQAVYEGVAARTEPHRALALLARGGCPPLLQVELHYIAEEGCSKAWATFARYVAATKPDVVVLVGGGSDLFDPSVAELEATGGWRGNRQAAFKHGLRQLIVALQQTSRVIYVNQFPQFETAPSCFLRRIRLPGTHCAPTLDRERVEARTASYDQIIGELRAELPGLHVVDARAALCEPTRCSQRLPSGEIIYSDEFHLSAAGGRLFVARSGLLDLLFAPPTTRGN